MTGPDPCAESDMAAPSGSTPGGPTARIAKSGRSPPLPRGALFFGEQTDGHDWNGTFHRLRAHPSDWQRGHRCADRTGSLNPELHDAIAEVLGTNGDAKALAWLRGAFDRSKKTAHDPSPGAFRSILADVVGADAEEPSTQPPQLPRPQD